MKHDRHGLVRCRVCGCTEMDACLEGCSWVENDLCSVCAVAAAAIADWIRGARRVNKTALWREGAAAEKQPDAVMSQENHSLAKVARPSLERLIAIARELRTKGHVSIAELSQNLEVSTKTVRRDLDFLRDRLRFEVVYQPALHRWYLVSAPIPTIL